MNKERFLGYLDHIRELAIDGFYSDADGVVEALDEIIKKAEQLEESKKTMGTPVHPPKTIFDSSWITWPSTPIVEPGDITFGSNTIEGENFDIDIGDTICYNSMLSKPNEWSVEKNSKLPHNWKIIK